MTNPVIDQERASFLRARSVTGKVQLQAWPRGQKDLDLVELEVEWVLFSTLNHRTRAEQRAEIAQTGDSGLFASDPMGPKAQTAQYAILRKQDGFRELKDDVKSRGQQEPAIVTADGVLINGNRRAAALRSLYRDDNQPMAHYIRCLVLPEDATPAELIDLETELQIARDFKQEYGWINEALLIEELYDREGKDFNRVATRMHRDISDVRSRYEKLQQVHQLVGISGGARHHIDFSENESAFDELVKHVKNKQPREAEAVRTVYFLGTLANVQYRKLRHLRRPDAVELVQNELKGDPTLSRLLAEHAERDSLPDEDFDPLDDALGNKGTTAPLTPLLSLLASKSPEESIQIAGGQSVAVANLLKSLGSAINAAAEEAEEDQRDQTAQITPLTRVDKAISEFERAISALPKARSFDGFDEESMTEKVARLRELISLYTPQEA